MLRGKSKVTQPPCFGSFALKRSFFRKAAAKAIYIPSVQKLILNGEIQKPVNITVPARGSGSAARLFLSKWLEEMGRGLEGPLKPSSPSAAVGEGKMYIQAAARAGAGGCSAWKPRVHLPGITQQTCKVLFQPLRRKLFQVQLMGCTSKGHPEELTLPGEADPQLYFSLLLFLLLQPLLGYDSLSEEEMKVQ